MLKTTKTINNLSLAILPAGLSENGDALLARPAASQSTGGGTFGFDRRGRSPERIAKAQAFHAALMERRRDPANCSRSGRTRDGAAKQCSKCRAYQARYRGRMVDEKLTAPQLVAMVKQMRREMDKMQVRFKQWQVAADYRRNLHYRTDTMRKKYLKPVSEAQAREYLSNTNHAWEDNDK